MSVHISARAWNVQGLSFAEKLVLLKLADMANDEGVCWPSSASIGLQCGLDRRSVRRIMARLEAVGLVHRRARFREGGLSATNWITVLPPADRRAESAGGDSAVPPSEGDSPVLPRKGDRAVLPGGTRRSSLGGTGRSSKPSIEPSLNQADAGSAVSVPRQTARLPRERGGPSAAPMRCEGDPAARLRGLTVFQRDRLRSGQSFLLDGALVGEKSALFAALLAALRSEDAAPRRAAASGYAGERVA